MVLLQHWLVLENLASRVEIHEIEKFKEREICKRQVVAGSESFRTFLEVSSQVLCNDVDLSIKLFWVTVLEVHANLIVQSVMHTRKHISPGHFLSVPAEQSLVILLGDVLHD